MQIIEIILALNSIVVASIAGLYWGLFKVHGCQKRTEAKLDAHFDAEFIKDEIIEIKDSIRGLKDEP